MPSRTLSEPEFDAIKAKILDAAPSGLKEDEFHRYIGPAMEQAIGEAENSPEPLTGSAIERLASGAWQVLNPMNLVNAALHPIDTVTGLAKAQGAEFSKFNQSAKEGRDSEALGHLVAGLVPVVGPAAAHAGERIASGDVAGGVGEGAALLAPIAAKEARGPIGRGTSAAGRVVEKVGKSAPIKRLGSYGAVGEAMHGNLPAAAGLALVPTALEQGGKVLQFVGDKIAGAKPPSVVAAVLSDLVAKQEVAAGRLPQSALAAIERAQQAKTAPVKRPAAQSPQPTTPAPIASPAPASPAGAMPQGQSGSYQPLEVVRDAKGAITGLKPVAQATPASPAPAAPQAAADLAARFDARQATPIEQAIQQLKAAAVHGKLTATQQIAALDFMRFGYSAEEALSMVAGDVPTAVKSAIKSPVAEGVTIYHNSPKVFAGNKPPFDAYFGDADFVKTFPNEWGPHTYKITLPADTKILDLNTGSKAAREFMAKVAESTYPDDPTFAAELRKGTASAVKDFYEAWTDKDHVLSALKNTNGYEAVRYQGEYVVPKSVTEALKGSRVKP